MRKDNFKTYLIIGLVVVLVIVIGGVALNGNLPDKLSASISDLNSNGIKIFCDDNVLNVNEETKCYVVGYLDDEITSIDGLISASSNLQVSDVSNTSNFKGDIEDGKISFYSVPQSKGKFDVATFKVSALKQGNGQIKFTDGKIGNSDFEKIEVDDATYGIQVMQ